MHKQTSLVLALTLSLSGSLLVSDQSHAAQTIYGRASYTYVRELRAANQYIQTGRLPGAESYYMGQLKKNPSNVAARGSLAFAQASLFKLDAAEKNAQEVLRRDPSNPLAQVALGVVNRNRTASMDMYYKAQRDDYLAKSAMALEKAVQAMPNSPEAHNELGITYRMQERYADAQQQFDKALSLDPKYAEALVNQGIMSLAQGKTAAARGYYKQAIQRNSKNYMAHYRLGEALVREGNYHEGIKSLNTALALNPGNASVMCKMADAYDKQGNTAAAVANYRKAIASNPGYMPAYTGLSNLLDSRGDGELAMAELKSALNVNPNYKPALNQLGRLALTVDKPDQAIQYYKEALAKSPKDAEALNGLSQAFTLVAQKSATQSEALGQESDLVNAELAIQEALRNNPNDMRLHLASIRLNQLSGKPALSEAELQQIMNHAPQNETEETLLGEAFLASGRYAEADTVFKRLMDRNGNNPDKLLVLADTLKANGDLESAKVAYQRAALAEPGNLKAQRGVQRIERAEAESQKTLRLAKSLNNFFQKASSVDYYEETLAKNPRQPEARLALSKLYEKYDQYAKAAVSYQFYLGLMPNMPEKERQKYERKITRMKELAQDRQNTPVASPSGTATPNAASGASGQSVAQSGIK